MKAMRWLTVAGLVVLAAATGARAHWDDTMPYKMHFPQHPDPNGWDIDMTKFVLADDWKCTQTGPVKDIHFWYSVQGDSELTNPVPPPHFTIVSVSIHNDVPVGPEGFSIPGDLKWDAVFTNVVLNGPFPGNQGWDLPIPNPEGVVLCEPNDHVWYWQVNITNIAEPFIQVADNIYWLDLQVQGLADGRQIGWKTTKDQYRDYAVYQNAAGGWSQIAVCTNDSPTDLAFVITPEPATIALLGFGAVGLLARRRRK